MKTKIVTLGKALREQRKRNKLTQKELSAKSGFSVKYISMIERDVYEPTGKIIKEIFLHLGCTTRIYNVGGDEVEI